MDNGMENMLDTYLFETNSLLAQLDELLINAEKSKDFTADNVNEIFRIMHTIKGSSAMNKVFLVQSAQNAQYNSCAKLPLQIPDRHHRRGR